MTRTPCTLVFPAVLAIGAACAQPVSGEHALVAYWSFDESGGPVARDYSGNGWDIRLSGVRRTTGVCGGALEFRAQRPLQCAPADAGMFLFPGDYTISAWVRHTSKRPQCYVSKWSGRGTVSAWWLGYYEHKAQFGDYFDGGQSRPHAVDVADGKWHQVVGVRRGRTAYLYVDGRLAARTPTPGRVAGYNQSPVLLGAYPGGWRFEGTIDEVRIYARALSHREIREQFERIRSGRMKPVTTVIPNSFADVAQVFALLPGPRFRGIHVWYPADEPVRIPVLVCVNKAAAEASTVRIHSVLTSPDGHKREKTVSCAIPARALRHPLLIDWPALPPGKYTFSASIPDAPDTHFQQEFDVLDLKAIVRENLEYREKRRRSGDPFARGIVSSYAGLLWNEQGRPDVDRTLEHIIDLGVNCYTYLISGSASDRVLEALPEFCTKAARHRIEVWAYLVPPTEAPIGRKKPIPERKYPPFHMDYLKWARAVARIGAAHPNLTLWMIDDFDGNTGFFTVDYTRRIYQTSKRIAPNLRFGVCVYHDSIHRFMKAGYSPWFDAVLWGYQHSSALYPEAGISARSLPIEINDYYKLCPDKVLIPCIYFTAHSSWPRDRPTRDYLIEALRISYEQAGICWVFTTPPRGSWKARIVRDFCRKVRPPLLPPPKR